MATYTDDGTELELGKLAQTYEYRADGRLDCIKVAVDGKTYKQQWHYDNAGEKVVGVSGWDSVSS